MIWNIIIHIILGAIGRKIWLAGLNGFLAMIVIVMLVQAIDMVRVVKYHRIRYETSAAYSSSGVPFKNLPYIRYKMIQYYVFLKTLPYGVITYATAQLAMNI